MTNFDWVDKRDEEIEESRGKDYFRIEEGENKFLLLSHFAPLAQTFNPATKKYDVAEMGEQGASIKGVCWVAQEDGGEWLVKQAKLPYTIVKMVRDLSKNDDWDFELPFKHRMTLNAVGAGTKEVKYSLQPSPKAMEIPESVLTALKEKKSPEDIVDMIKSSAANAEADGGKD